MNIEWKTVKGSQKQQPESYDDKSSPTTVYLRKNFRCITEICGEKNVVLWEYEEASFQREQISDYCIELLNRQDQQMKDLENAVCELSEVMMNG